VKRALTLAAAALLAATPAAAQEIAVTMDDLPRHSEAVPGQSQADIARALLGAFKSAGVPEVYGFLNGANDRDADTEEVLRLWRAAGHPLGNHGWSHAHLPDLTPEQLAAEIDRNEPMLAKWMGNADWHWFRYPFLDEGRTPEQRAAIRVELARRGYRIAAVTLDFGDWALNGPYVRCAVKGDKAAMATLEGAYVHAAEVNLGYFRAMSKALYGRDIPYVLLTHMGAIDAKMLPAVLAMYKRNGFHFTTLEKAESNPAYADQIDPKLAALPAGPEGKMRAKNLPLPPRDLPDYAKLCM